MNKKASFGISLFGFFFALSIVTGILFFILTVLPAVLYTYGIDTAVTINQDLVDQGISSQLSQDGVTGVAASYKQLYNIADYMFMFFILSVFIQSIISASRARREGILSFFGLITLGNIVLIFILHYAIEIQNWILNDIVYNILLVSFDVPFTFWFFEWNLYIGVVWFVILLMVNIIDFQTLGSKFGFVTPDEDARRFEE